MENQSGSKLRIVLMAGFPGTGKTTLANALGKALRWHVLDKDWLKHSLSKHLSEQDTDIDPEKIGIITYELLFDMTEDILVRVQSSVILDTSARYPFILEHATQIAHAANAKLKIVLCITQSSQRKERINARTDLYLCSTNAFEITVIENDLAHFKHLPEDILIVETKDPLETYFPKAIEYLSAEERL